MQNSIWASLVYILFKEEIALSFVGGIRLLHRSHLGHFSAFIILQLVGLQYQGKACILSLFSSWYYLEKPGNVSNYSERFLLSKFLTISLTTVICRIEQYWLLRRSLVLICQTKWPLRNLRSTLRFSSMQAPQVLLMYRVLPPEGLCSSIV